ncbi:MAG TPA: chloride channel protein [Symbiobacteriaceae bacterium]|nr:chloride channel protein [Symbiobacteriaceae bacterium]
MPERFRLIRVAALGAVVGLLGVGAAFILTRMIGLFLNLLWFGRVGFQLVEPHNSPYAGAWWTVLLPVAGAGIIGLMLRYGSPVISGHGIPEAMEAVMLRQSRIQAKVALLKPISAAISIGSGGPYGAEGPVIMTGGALGSLLGQVLPTSPEERKVLLAAGAAAGMVAIFGTPISAVLLVLELLVFEFSTRAFVPVAVAAGVAAALRANFFGESGALFPDVPVVPIHGSQVLWYLLFGVMAGLAAAGMTWLLYQIEDLYEHLPGLNRYTRPMAGAVVVGLVGLVFPRALGVGYDTIAGLLRGDMTLGLVAGILVWKFAAWSISLGSGTSGGVLAPVLMVGGALGALVGHLVQPWSGIPSGLVALVVMGALFGASTRATLAAVLFAAEVTGHYDALVPLLITAAVADMVAVRTLPYSLMTGKLIRRGRQVVQDFTAPLATPVEAQVAHGD